MIVSGSSNVAEINYNNGTLSVRFHSQAVYEYYNVPERVYNEFAKAPSKGEYHAAFIKDIYAYKRVR